MAVLKSHRLLHPDDPDPVEIVNGDGDGRIVLTCEHAGRAIPCGWQGYAYPWRA